MVANDGTYTLDLSAPASYMLSFYSDGCSEIHIQVDVAPGTTTQVPLVEFPTPASLSGQCLDLSGIAMSGAVIQLLVQPDLTPIGSWTCNGTGNFFIPLLLPSTPLLAVVTAATSLYAPTGSQLITSVFEPGSTNIVDVVGDSVSPSGSIISPVQGSSVSGLVSVNVSASDGAGLQAVILYCNYAWTDTVEYKEPYPLSVNAKLTFDSGVYDSGSPINMYAVVVDLYGNSIVTTTVTVYATE